MVSDTTPQVGQTLSATTGSWTPSGLSYAYQWYRGASQIGGATSATYVVTDDDAPQGRGRKGRRGQAQSSRGAA